MIKLVWNQRSTFASLQSSVAPSTMGSASDVNLTEKTKEKEGVVNEKEVAAIVEKKKNNPEKKKKKHLFGLGYWFSDSDDVEKTAEGPSERPMRLFAPFYGGIAAALSVCECIISALRRIAHCAARQTTWAVASMS